MGGLIDETVAAIKDGHPVILPTDTVYGLCADAYHDQAAWRVYRLKGRAATQPTALICADVDMLFECVPELLGRAGVFARTLLPGPYTLVFHNPGRRYPWFTGAAPDTIGVRVPVLSPAVREIVGRVGAVMATSANLAGGRDPARLADIPEEIRNACAVVIDGGTLPGVPSTVIDLTGHEPRVLREGAVPAAEALARLAHPAAA